MRITVSITSYNQVAYLSEAIDSVLGQTLRPDTIRIIDDCSTDDSVDLIQSYGHEYPGLVQHIFHEQNRGVSACRNEAISLCEGGLHTFLDGDDRFLPEKLECEYSMLQQQPDSFAFGNINYIDDRGRFLYTWDNAGADYNGDIFTKVFGRGFPRRGLFRSELVNVQAYEKLGEFDPVLGNLYEDFDMRIRLSKKYTAIYTDTPLSEYRIHPRGLSNQGKAEHIRRLDYILDKNLDLLQDLPQSRKWTAMKGYLNYLHAISLLAARESYMDNQILAGLGYLLRSSVYKCRAMVYAGRASR